MNESNSEVSTMEDDSRAATGGENNILYNCDTRNRFDDVRVGRDGESASRDDNSWETARRKKRKRQNTGSVDIDHFQTLNKDEQLAAIFSKLVNIERSQHALHGLEPVVHNNVEHIRVAEKHIDTNTRRIKMIAYKQMEIETKLKQNNLIFRGIRDARDENVYEVIDEVMRERLQVDAGVVYIEQAYRLGSYRKAAENAKKFNDVPRRPILVSFRYHEDAERVLSRAKNLRGTKYSIDRDYPTEIVAARRRIWADFKRLRSENPRSNVVLKYPARIEVDGNTVYDQFPEWNEFNRERATCDYTHTVETPAPTPQMAQTIQPRRNQVRLQPTVNMYDADTESEPDQSQVLLGKQNQNKQSKTQKDIPSSQSHESACVPRQSNIDTQNKTLLVSSGSDDNVQSQSLLNPPTNKTQNSCSLQSPGLESSQLANPVVNQNTNIVTREDSMCSDKSS